MSMNDDLTPSDGLSNLWIEFDGIECPSNEQNGVRFRIISRGRSGEPDRLVSTLTLQVGGSSELYEMVALAHDALIRFLRQALYASDIMRKSYRKSAEQIRRTAS